jgi:hypothetical protein
VVGGVGELTLPDLPDAPVKTGWIDRWPDATGDDPLRAVNIGAVLAPLGIGEKHVAAAVSDWVPPVPDDIAKTLDALSDDDPHDTRAMGAVREAYRANSNTTRCSERWSRELRARRPNDGQRRRADVARRFGVGGDVRQGRRAVTGLHSVAG